MPHPFLIDAGTPRERNLHGLLSELQALAVAVAPYNSGAAYAYRHAAEQLREALDADDADLLTLRDAARESGFSADHLGRLVRDGKIPNFGRRNAPRVRREDLPRKVALQSRRQPVLLDKRRIALGVTNLLDTEA